MATGRMKEFDGGKNEQSFRNDLWLGKVDKIHPGGKWSGKSVKKTTVAKTKDVK